MFTANAIIGHTSACLAHNPKTVLHCAHSTKRQSEHFLQIPDTEFHFDSSQTDGRQNTAT